jgi:hypothetical protein
VEDSFPGDLIHRQVHLLVSQIAEDMAKGVAITVNENLVFTVALGIRHEPRQHRSGILLDERLGNLVLDPPDVQSNDCCRLSSPHGAFS